jgi:3,4-dihydroxy-2-butanone 4-phosphate synthase
MNQQEAHPEIDRSVFATIDDALEDLRQGKVILVVDDADRENEGDFIIAAEHCGPEDVNFMVTHGRGIVCLPVAGWRLDQLQIAQMVTANAGDETAFTVSIDYRPAITTGTSAHDRAVTARAVTDPSVGPGDFQRPGHVFPLRARSPTPRWVPSTSSGPGTSSRCARRTAGSSVARATPRPRSTSRCWPACSRPG